MRLQKQLIKKRRVSVITLNINVFFVSGGNSRTAMIAALSPADINYEETLSTLRSDIHVDV